ncbi:chromatin associated protein KTI12 [Desarmillaria tabescens]|uniref:Chromatin associated protein KTI12 n=1 Tax=Armillaria tabescens TaxID=1929756 RepID=A0AA39NDB2_ARMTA|nr:chromatin associated protein KTI12 [Desarmillaria tabescens]KAK0463552.1 chromatin associated protein KTI12 [Desarmillaria tabescens]
MALITISGYPCSGKSRRAHQIVTSIQEKLKDPNYTGPQLTVVLISDESLNIPRSAYDDSRSEKPARGALFTALQRQISLKNIVVVDAPNYIKGFRYQIYCAAREFKVRVCTVYVVATPERCREWNSARPESERYAPETLENLIQRYEEPSSMVRWDSPLFTILWTDEDIPSADIWKAITDGAVKPPNSGTLSVTKAPTDALVTLENTTLSIVSSIMSEQGALQGPGGTVQLPISSTLKPKVHLPARNLTLSELQRLKRQFVTVHKKAITLGTTERGHVDWHEDKIAEKFVVYLEEHLKD